uniref:Uncharacterized protein n=1 Tax=Picea sitchensis TaxID=3332 RepID=A9NXQ7_PICSI|nr:unknown [Picea sitchensis]
MDNGLGWQEKYPLTHRLDCQPYFHNAHLVLLNLEVAKSSEWLLFQWKRRNTPPKSHRRFSLLPRS